MNAAAVEVVKQFTDIVIAYGQSDEYRYDHSIASSMEKRKETIPMSMVLHHVWHANMVTVSFCMKNHSSSSVGQREYIPSIISL